MYSNLLCTESHNKQSLITANLNKRKIKIADDHRDRKRSPLEFAVNEQHLCDFHDWLCSTHCVLSKPVVLHRNSLEDHLMLLLRKERKLNRFVAAVWCTLSSHFVA